MYELNKESIEQIAGGSEACETYNAAYDLGKSIRGFFSEIARGWEMAK